MKKIIIVIVVILFIIGSSLATYSLSNNTHSQSNQLVQDTKQNIVPLDTAATIVSSSTEARYFPYSPEEFERTAKTRRVLFFYADWCPTCRPADVSFMENQTLIPSDVTVLRVNYNDDDTDQAEKDLAKKYAVTYQHTYVQIDADGNEVVKWNGGQIEELLNNLQ